MSEPTPRSSGDKEKISVIMPSYNARGYIGKSIQSLQSQSYKNWELIVVDDASTDGTHSVVRTFQRTDCRIRFLSQKTQGGPAAARNCGISQASGEFLYFLDADDLLEPEAFLKCLSALQSRDIDAVTFDSMSFTDKQNQPTRPPPSYDRSSVLKNEITYDINVFSEKCYQFNVVLPNPCLYIFRRSVLDGIRFPESSRYGEDSLYCFLACLRTRKITYLAHKLHKRRWRSNSLVGTTSWEEKMNGYLFNLNALDKVTASAENAIAHAIFRHATLHRAIHCFFRMQDNAERVPAESNSHLSIFHAAARIHQGNRRLKQRIIADELRSL